MVEAEKLLSNNGNSFVKFSHPMENYHMTRLEFLLANIMYCNDTVYRLKGRNSRTEASKHVGLHGPLGGSGNQAIATLDRSSSFVSSWLL